MKHDATALLVPSSDCSLGRFLENVKRIYMGCALASNLVYMAIRQL